ncbi:unnamed protein product [Peronospora belbahrii]|uniref:Uncharacterized protein n=1 Tax=Peronospora belbahrii TaxID=622444 RepID=A0ABN8CT72_9STRA|nr:unnamed protein product [Peronospora belbahrii]
MVPISLYISLEVVKWYQAQQIENDPKMYCTSTGRGVTARTSNVNEDLGQIKHIFSDKTGTLTKNQMLLKVCSIGGIIFDGSNMHLRRTEQGHSDNVGDVNDMRLKFDSAAGISRDGSATGRPKPKCVTVTKKDVRPHSDMIEFVKNPSRLSEKEMHALELARPFFRCLLLCHSASVAIEKKPSDETDRHSAIGTQTNSVEDTMQAECNRQGSECSSCQSRSTDATDAFSFGKDNRKYFGSSPDEVALLNAALEFDCVYERRDRDVIHIRLFGKPKSYQLLAVNEFDSTRKYAVMFANANKDEDISKLALHVHYFAAMALRTLLLGYPKEIEKSTKLLSVTGVEDVLQDGVREGISQLSLGGINIWMLTGDKDEIAISVAQLCGLIGPNSKIIIIKGKTKQDCLDEIAKARRKLKRDGVWIPGVASQDLLLVVNGEALE